MIASLSFPRVDVGVDVDERSRRRDVEKREQISISIFPTPRTRVRSFRNHPSATARPTSKSLARSLNVRCFFADILPSFVRFDSNGDDEPMDGCACETEDKTVIESTSKDSENPYTPSTLSRLAVKETRANATSSS